MISAERLDYITAQFHKKPDLSFTAQEFLLAMREIVPLKCKPSDSKFTYQQHEFSLFHGLYTLFLMIDVNCDGDLSWKEFSDYLISNSGNNKDANEVKIEEKHLFNLKNKGKTEKINLL